MTDIIDWNYCKREFIKKVEKDLEQHLMEASDDDIIKHWSKGKNFNYLK